MAQMHTDEGERKGTARKAGREARRTRYRDAFLGSLLVAIVMLAASLIYLLAFNSHAPNLAGTEWGNYRKVDSQASHYERAVLLRFEEGGRLTYKKRDGHIATGKYHLGNGHEASLEITRQAAYETDVLTRKGESRPINSAREIIVDKGKLSLIFSDGAIADFVPLSKALTDLSDRRRQHLDLVANSSFMEPVNTETPASYAFVSSRGKEQVLKGSTFHFDATGFTFFHSKDRLDVYMRDWESNDLQLSFRVGHSKNVGIGKYQVIVADRPSSRDWLPAIYIACGGQGVNEGIGEFVIWEIEIDTTTNKLQALAVDFVLREFHGRGAPVYGAIRFHSKFE